METKKKWLIKNIGENFEGIKIHKHFSKVKFGFDFYDYSIDDDKTDKEEINLKIKNIKKFIKLALPSLYPNKKIIDFNYGCDIEGLHYLSYNREQNYWYTYVFSKGLTFGICKWGSLDNAINYAVQATKNMEY